MWALGLLAACGNPDDAEVVEAQNAYVKDEATFRELLPYALCRELRDCSEGVPVDFDEETCIAKFQVAVDESSCVDVEQSEPCISGVLLPTAPGYEACQNYFDYPSSVCTLAVYDTPSGECR